MAERKQRKPQSIKITSPRKINHPFLGKNVAFSLGFDRPDWLGNDRVDKFAEHLFGEKYLIGTVNRTKDRSGGYIVDWEATVCGKTILPGHTCFEGINLYNDLQKKKHDQQSKSQAIESNVSAAIREKLMEVDDDKVGSYYSSDDEEQINTSFGGSQNHVENLNLFPSTRELQDERDVMVRGLVWKTKKREIPAPINLSQGEKMTLIDKYRMNFMTPLSSFLSFVPIEFWRLWLFETNRYAKEQVNVNKRSFRDMTLSEFMNFFGIMLEMTLSPTPGRRYTWAWDYPDLYPFVNQMTKNRFVQIRGYLHMVNNNAHQEVQDSLFKVRPLLNVLKNIRKILCSWF